MGMGWYCDFLQPHSGCWTAVCRQKLLLVSPWLRPGKRRIDPLLPRYRQHRAVIERQCAAKPMMLAPSHKVAREFQQEHAYPAERIRVVYHGVDVERFSPEHCARQRESVRRKLDAPKKKRCCCLWATTSR